MKIAVIIKFDYQQGVRSEAILGYCDADKYEKKIDKLKATVETHNTDYTGTEFPYFKAQFIDKL